MSTRRPLVFHLRTAEAEPGTMMRPHALAADFATLYGRTPRLFRAPGRINLIGEHTDYNDGFVMPMALDRTTIVAAAAREDRLIVARSDQGPGIVQIDLDAPLGAATGTWGDYVAGVAAVLDRTVRLTGADVMIRSDVPIGAGLSSSAALEVACGFALLTLAAVPVDRTMLALACQKAEHDFVGMRCGIMDQFIACHARAACALMLDTRTLTPAWLPIPDDLRVLACNTMVTHQLASAAGYNDRRAECEAAVRALAAHVPAVRSLRDVTPAALDAAARTLPDVLYRRCRHVVRENERVEKAAAALRSGDAAAFGRLMHESHDSLRDDYEVSCRELDIMVEAASALEGVYGARMTGGGFGGCAIALVDAERAETIASGIRERYQARTGVRSDIWICSAGEGVMEIGQR